MALTNKQIATLLNMIGTSRPEEMDCDGCYEHMAEFAEAELASQEIPEALRAVQTHLEQCQCCKDEHDALLEGLRTLQKEG